MVLRKMLCILTAVLIIMTVFCSGIVFSDATSYVSMQLDRTSAGIGEVIKATISVHDIRNFAGFQLNIKYDPEVLQPVTIPGENPYTNSTLPGNGTILNSGYGAIPLVENNLSAGYISFSKIYQSLESYRASGKPEETGVLCEIGFKVLKNKNTEIKFINSASMPSGIDGTLLFDWNSKYITDYTVIQPDRITALLSTPNPGEQDFLEAEHAFVSGGEVKTEYSGYSGSGYIDFDDSYGNYIEWTINVTQPITKKLEFRYANGTAKNKMSWVYINGISAPNVLTFSPTEGWSDWRIQSVDVKLESGSNVIRLFASSFDGGANIDYLEIKSLIVSVPSVTPTETPLPTKTLPPTTPTKTPRPTVTATKTPRPSEPSTNTPKLSVTPTPVITAVVTSGGLINTPILTTSPEQTPVISDVPTITDVYTPVVQTPVLTPPSTSSTAGMKIIVDSERGYTGERVDVAIRFTGVPSGGIYSTDFRLTFKTNVLEVESVTAGNITVNPARNFDHYVSKNQGIINFMYIDDTDTGSGTITANGVFAKVTFIIKPDAPVGFSELSITNSNFTDYSLNDIATEYIKGGISIEGAGTGTSETVTSTPLPVTSVTPSTVTPTTATPTPMFSTTPTVTPTVTPTLLLSATPTVTPNGFSIRVGYVQGMPGSTVVLPVEFLRVPTNGLNNFDFKVEYNPNQLEILEVRHGEIVLNSVGFDSNINASARNVVIMYADETGTGTNIIINDGVVAYITIRIKDNVNPGLSLVKPLSSGGFADKNLTVVHLSAPIPGGVTVSNNMTITASPTPTYYVYMTPTPYYYYNTTPSPYVSIDKPYIPSSGEHRAYMQGYPDGYFRPEKNITRAEAAIVFANLQEADMYSYYGNISFSDVNDEHWSAWAIKYVYSKGLFSGYPDGTFQPDKSITRAEFTTVVYKLLGAGGMNIITSKFHDTNGHWAEQYIEELAGRRYINGYSDGTFKPNSNITRAESVALINRALNRGPLYGTPQIFPDVPPLHWAFMDIAEGVMNHRYKLDSSGHETIAN